MDMQSLLQYYPIADLPSRDSFSSKEKTVLDRINQKVAAGRSLEEIMDFFFEATQEIFPCDRIGLSFAEDHAQRVVAHWAKASYEPLLLKAGYHEDLAGSSLEAVLRDGKVRLITNLEKYLQQKPDSVSTKILVREGVRSSMTCPLYVDDRAVGFLFRSSRKPGMYNEHQVGLHLALTERLSQAIEKAWRIEQLDQANKAYMEMLGFVTHELKSPLASIVTDARLLEQGYLGQLTPKQQEKIQKMILKSQYLSNLIVEYLDLAKVEGGQMKLNAQNIAYVADVIEPAIEMIQPQIDKNRMTLLREFPPEEVTLNGDPQLLRIVMINLIGNAAKYGRKEGQIKITVRKQQDTIHTSVWNQGPGFDPAQKDLLFKRFSRLSDPELLKRKGTGVGLYTTWRIIQLHRGKIRAESEKGNWACFEFTLPKDRPEES